MKYSKIINKLLLWYDSFTYATIKEELSIDNNNILLFFQTFVYFLMHCIHSIGEPELLELL